MCCKTKFLFIRYYSCIWESFTFQMQSFSKNIKTIDKIRDEKLQYDMNRKATKISVVSSCKIDKYEYFTDEEILPANHQSQIIEQVKFTYYSLAKDLEKQARTIGDEAKKLTKNDWR